MTLAEPTAYCMKCREKKPIKDPYPDIMKNGRDCVRGSCPTCNTRMFRIGKMPAKTV